jgi:hypothetical protein
MVVPLPTRFGFVVPVQVVDNVPELRISDQRGRHDFICRRCCRVCGPGCRPGAGRAAQRCHAPAEQHSRPNDGRDELGLLAVGQLTEALDAAVEAVVELDREAREANRGLVEVRGPVGARVPDVASLLWRLVEVGQEVPRSLGDLDRPDPPIRCGTSTPVSSNAARRRLSSVQYFLFRSTNRVAGMSRGCTSPLRRASARPSTEPPSPNVS